MNMTTKRTAATTAAWWLPLGAVKWPWFVVLSFLGGLGFSLPLYYWLNRGRPAA